MKTKALKIDGKRIKRHAEAGRWYPSLIARKAGVSRQIVYAVFDGKTDPKATTLKRICDVIGLPMDDAFRPTKVAA